MMEPISAEEDKTPVNASDWPRSRPSPPQNRMKRAHDHRNDGFFEFFLAGRGVVEDQRPHTDEEET